MVVGITAYALSLVLSGCGGGGGASSTATVLQLTEALGYELVFDPELEINGHPYVAALKRNGTIVLQGNLQFTVNGHIYGDGDGPVGNKSVVSRVNAGDTIAWQTL